MQICQMQSCIERKTMLRTEMKMNIHKNKMLWYNTKCCIGDSYERSRSMEYRYSVKEWRIGEPKNKSGYRTIPLTEEEVTILKEQKE